MGFVDGHYISVAIDGYSKCGKSTLAKMVSKKYNFLYIDSGALYRFVTYITLGKSISTEKDLFFLQSIYYMNDGTIIYENRPYGDAELGCDAVNNAVSIVAQNGIVRRLVNEWILSKSKNTSIIMDGRDIGTEVLPCANVKVFLFSSLDYRMSQWRKLQIEKYGYIDKAAEKKEEKNLKERDHNDITRKIAPLKCALDAIQMDVQKVSINDIYSYICSKIDYLLANDI